MSDTDRNYGYVPFIAGPRGCLGSHLSLLEASIVLAALVYEYEIRVEGGGEERERARRKHPFMVPVVPEGGVKVRMRKRGDKGPGADGKRS